MRRVGRQSEGCSLHTTPCLPSIFLCVWRGNASVFKTASPAKHWQHPYIPEVDKKAMATAGVRTSNNYTSWQRAMRRQQWHPTNYAAVRLGFENTGAIVLDVLLLGQDLCQKPVTLCRFPHLHRFMVFFPLHTILAFQMSTINRQQISIVSKTEPAWCRAAIQGAISGCLWQIYAGSED